MYESSSGEISIAVLGDILLTRRLRIYREKEFRDFIGLMRRADAALGNLECPIRATEGVPKSLESTLGANFFAPPWILEELKWAGIDMLACANNHADDWGEGGILSTVKYCDEAGLPHAGIGRDLTEASRPAYLDTVKGRIALISVDTTQHSVRATQSRPDCAGRPGANVLRHEVTYTVERPTMDMLRAASNALGMEAHKAHYRAYGPHASPSDSDLEFHFLGKRFVLGDRFETHTTPNADDLSNILNWVDEARRQADWVVLYFHMHEPEPPEFVRTFVHACIDAGVDLVCNASKRIRAIEMYKGKPIFYALGNFALQMETVEILPDSSYELQKVNKGNSPATPADFYDAFFQHDKSGFPASPDFWQSIMAVADFSGRMLKEVRLYPLYGGYKTPRTQRGRCMLADPKLAAEILAKTQERSKSYGTSIRIDNSVGIISP